MAFLDIRPLSRGHTLIIPIEHYETVFDIPEELLAHVHKTAKHVAIAIKKSINADGISIISKTVKQLIRTYSIACSHNTYDGRTEVTSFVLMPARREQ